MKRLFSIVSVMALLALMATSVAAQVPRTVLAEFATSTG
jgi:hypothetical protein